MRLGVWAALEALWRPHHAVPPSPADDRVVTDALRIRRTLGELARLESPLALQSADGRFMGGGVLSVDGVVGVRIHCQPGTDLRAEAAPWPINVTASTGRGLVLFTLTERLAATSQQLFAAWPDQFILVQSRRHFRLSALAGKRRRAWLSRQGSADRVPVCDLSEEGIGLEVPPGTWPESSPPGEALLHLDDEVIPVPRVEVVHTRRARSGGPAVVGARMLGLGEDHLRLLRRWITAVQAVQVSGAGGAV